MSNLFQFNGKKWVEIAQNGYTPIKGVDYFDGKDGYTPVKDVDYFDGEPGKDGSPDTGADMVKKINSLPIKPEFQITADHIKDLPPTFQRIIEQHGMQANETILTAGENVSITKDAFGKWVISATGGGSTGFSDFTITRSGDYISSVLVGSTTYTYSRTGAYISSVTDGSQTLTFTRNGDNQITEGVVS